MASITVCQCILYIGCKLQRPPVSKFSISFLPPGQAEAEHVPNNQLYICPVYPVDWTSTSRYLVHPVFSGISSMTFLLQAKERWTMYQLKAHFMPQLYWFGLIKVTLYSWSNLVFSWMVIFSNLPKITSNLTKQIWFDARLMPQGWWEGPGIFRKALHFGMK